MTATNPSTSATRRALPGYAFAPTTVGLRRHQAQPPGANKHTAFVHSHNPHDDSHSGSSLVPRPSSRVHNLLRNQSPYG
jgi:hypothetical protein